MILALFLTHWWEYNFIPAHEAWYHGATWPNVFVLLPLSVLGFIGWLWHKGAVDETHKKIDALAKKHDEHAEKLKKVLDALDPETDGGIQEVMDRLDPETPGGLEVLDTKIDKWQGDGITKTAGDLGQAPPAVGPPQHPNKSRLTS